MMNLKRVNFVFSCTLVVSLVIGNVCWSNFAMKDVDPCIMPVSGPCPLPAAYCHLRSKTGCPGAGALIANNFFFPGVDGLGHFSNLPGDSVTCYTPCTCVWEAQACSCMPTPTDFPVGQVRYVFDNCVYY